MKKITFIVFFLFTGTLQVFTQWLNPTPFGMVKTTAGFCLNQSRTYIAGDNGNIYYTPNLGQNWNSMFNNKTDNLKNIFMLSTAKGFATGDNGKILRMTDGYIWTEIYTAPNSNLYGLYFTDENTGYTGGGNGGLLKTTNGGSSWQSISYSDRNIYCIQFINSNTGYIAEYARIMKTTNAGMSWFVISDTAVHSPQKVYFQNENTGYSAGIGELCKTTNGGINWVRKYSFSGACTGLCFTDTLNAFLTAGYDVSKTTDGGNSWTTTTLSTPYGLSGAVFMNSTTGVVFESAGKIFRTTDGGNSWNTTTKYITDAHISDVKFSGTKKGWACTGGIYIYKTTNSGTKWDTISLGTNTINNIAIADSVNLWGFNGSQSLGKSSNGGVNWSFQSYPFSNNISVGKFLNKSTGWVYGENGSIYKTTNEGNSWSDVSIGPGAFISKLQFINSQTGWASSSAGFYRLYKTTNGGINWTGSFINAAGYGKSVCFYDVNTGFFLGDSVFSKTTDGGNSWTELRLGFSGARDMFFYAPYFGYCLAGASKIYSTISAGNSWGSYSNYNYIYSIFSMYYDGDRKIWFGGTYGSIFGYEISPIDLVHQVSAFADNYSLSQNYPNPFNPSTKINYEIKSSGFVSLKILDLLGKEVAVLVNENQSSGSYAVDFNSSEFNLPSGIYFYRLKTNGFTETKKMMLVK